MESKCYIFTTKNTFKEIFIEIIYRPLVHSITSDRKLYDQIIKVSISFESVILEDYNLPLISREKPLKSHMGYNSYKNLLEKVYVR